MYFKNNSYYYRVGRLIRYAIDKFNLNLTDIVVLTEAASGNFLVTPLIAACAKAKKVIAITKDSRYGSAEEIINHTKKFYQWMELPGKIEFVTKKSQIDYTEINLVTNLGFVRPINRVMLSKLPEDAAIALMWEPWEFRNSDLDLDYCREQHIPVLGTNERDKKLQIFNYIGYVVMKLLFEVQIEVFKSKLLLISSGFFGEETQKVLSTNHAYVHHINPEKDNLKDKSIESFLSSSDAIVLVEHRLKDHLIGHNTGIPIEWIKKNPQPIIHLCGNLDYSLLGKSKIKKYPINKVKLGSMSVTTDYIGPKPVIDLHTAGLKVGQALVNGKRKYKSIEQVIRYALDNSPAMDF